MSPPRSRERRVEGLRIALVVDSPGSGERGPLTLMTQERTDVDRRQTARGTSHDDPARPHLVSMIVGAYREMPGLSLHLHQAARLFGVRPRTCQVVMDHLVSSGQLRRTADGQYKLG